MMTAQRKMALAAGLSLIVMAIVAGVAFGGMFQELYIAGDANATLASLNNSSSLFRMFIFLFVIILILDVIVAWALYIFFKPVDEPSSLLSALFRLVYCSLLGTSFLSLISVMHLLNDTPQSAGNIMNGLGTFSDMWSLGLIIFSGHLFLLGYLIFKSGNIPRVFGYLMVLAAACYLLTNVANLLMANYGDYRKTVDMIAGLPMAIGEIGFAIWLVVKGGRVPQSLS